MRVTGPAGKATQTITKWTSITNQVGELAADLRADERVELVVVEATSDYWRQVYFLLQRQG